MPTSRRGGLIRKHVAVENALDRAMGWTWELYDIFLADHPEYSDGYANIAIMLEQAKEFIAKMKGFV